MAAIKETNNKPQEFVFPYFGKFLFPVLLYFLHSLYVTIWVVSKDDTISFYFNSGRSYVFVFADVAGLGQVQLKLGELKGSVSNFEKVLEVYPDNCETLKVMLFLYWSFILYFLIWNASCSNFFSFFRLSDTYTLSLEKLIRPLSTCGRPQNLIHVMPRSVWFHNSKTWSFKMLMIVLENTFLVILFTVLNFLNIKCYQ